MRISNDPTQQILGAQGVKGPRSAKGAVGAGPAAGADGLSVSSMGQEIQKAMQALGGIPDIRSERVAEIRAQIANNTYHVPGREIAEHVLRGAADKNL